MASIWRRHTVIKLLSDYYDLDDFIVEAFPETFFNDAPKSPFQNLSQKRDITKVTLEPLFCSLGKIDTQCVVEDT